MDQGAKFIGLFIVAIMVFSMGGFALFSAAPIQNTNKVPDFPLIINRTLTDEERLLILQTGRSLIEFSQGPDCIECADYKITLEMFTKVQNGFVILEEFEGNETSIWIIGGGSGDIKNIETVTEESLLAALCEVAATKPKDCLLREI